MKLMFPALVFYTSKLPDRVAGRAHGPVILIKKKYRDDKGLHAHEMCHAWQWYLTLMLHSLLYKLSTKYRLWAEVQAYKKQLKYSPGNESKYAGFIAERYRLDVTMEEAERRLME
jgi:hypothetical protein